MDTEQVKQLYEVEFLGVAEIARRLGTNQVKIAWHLGVAGVPLRDKSSSLKGRPKSEAHKAKLRVNIAKARLAVTDESRRKQAEKMRGRPSPLRGRKWSEEARKSHMAVRQTDEYRRKQSEWQLGEKSPSWRGGQTDEETRRMQGWEWKKRRRECYERDNWTCQDCQTKCNSKGKTRIQCHHIVSRRDGGGDELENLVTLCASCHHKREALHRASPKLGAAAIPSG